MLVIVCGWVVPLLVLALVWMRVDRRVAQSRDRTGTPPVSRDRVPRTRLAPASRWEGLTEEIARRGNRRYQRRSDAALRRRHLAAVLPADARR